MSFISSGTWNISRKVSQGTQGSPEPCGGPGSFMRGWTARGWPQTSPVAYARREVVGRHGVLRAPGECVGASSSGVTRPPADQLPLESPRHPTRHRWGLTVDSPSASCTGSRVWRVTRRLWGLRAAASLLPLPRPRSVRPASQRREWREWAVLVPSLVTARAAASAPPAEGDLCLCFDSRPLRASPWEVNAATLQGAPTLSSFTGQRPPVLFVQAVHQDGPCRSSARTTK